MAYVSLYRRYRPNTFDGVIGQDHIVRVLRNQVINSHISHAYLFTGTRGTGKTSVAKIFAKAINCENPVNGSPCNECATCRAINDSYDIIELDAASNTGADSIRDLQESVKYRPSIGKYKVFIIDEVHMLSASAFNALLKTLEEPPEYVVFVLATTEIHLLPATVLSRCLKFDFRLVSSSTIASRIKLIYDEIGLKCEPEAIMQIAEAGDGSVRDALSIADMCLSYCSGELKYSDVLEVLGAGDPNKIIEIIESILSEDCSASLKKISELINLGKSISGLARDILKMFRNLYIVMQVDDANSILNLPEDTFAALVALSRHDKDNILNIIEMLSGLETKMKFASVPRALLESAVARACDVKANIDVNGLLLRVKDLEKQVGGILKNGVRVTNTPQNIEPINPIPMTARGVLAELLSELRINKELVFLESVKELKESSLKFGDDILIIEVEDSALYGMISRKENKEKIMNILSKKFIIKAVETRMLGVANINDDVEKIKALFSEEIISIKK